MRKLVVNFTCFFTSFIDQFVLPVGGEGMGSIAILASCEYYFLKVHENVVNIQVIMYRLLPCLSSFFEIYGL